MSNSKKRWTAILLAMCLMLGRMWLFTPGKCAPLPKSVLQEIEAQRQAVILNALKASLNNPLLTTEAQSFSELINAKGLGGLVQDYLQMDLTDLSDAEKALRQAFETAMVNGDVGSGGPPYVSITNNDGQWIAAISNGPSGAANGAASPNSAPTTDSGQPGGAGNGSGNSDDKPAVESVDDKLLRELPPGAQVAIINEDMDTTGHRSVTLTVPSDPTAGPKIFGIDYVNGAWKMKGSSSGPIMFTVIFVD